jgi:hypothetical protein
MSFPSDLSQEEMEQIQLLQLSAYLAERGLRPLPRSLVSCPFLLTIDGQRIGSD